MARVPLSKAQLARERQTLAQVNRFLPALDLKRQQLMGERNRARHELARLREEFKALVDSIGEDLPMLADRRIDLSGLARLTSMKHGTQNIAGERVPMIELSAIAEQVRVRVLRWFARSRLVEPDDVRDMRAPRSPTRPNSSFSLDAAVRVGAHDRAGPFRNRERLLRDCARPTFALERLERLDDERVVYRLLKPQRDGITALTLTPSNL